jgi:hypothetical protein
LTASKFKGRRILFRQKTETDGTNRLTVPAGAFWGIPRSCRLHFIEVAGDMQAVDLVLG